MSYHTNKIDDKVIGLLKSGGIGFLPSDTIYGLSCLALNKNAVQKIHKIKDREAHKPFIVLISSINQLADLGVSKKDAEGVFRYWPGPISIVMRADQSPDWLTLNHKDLAIRMPKDRKLADLINEVGPIISTSANMSGEDPITNPTDASQVFGDQLDFYVDVGRLEGTPSTIIKIENSEIIILRQGAVKI